MHELEPVRRTFTLDEIVVIWSAANWLVGYVEGAGREVPPHVNKALGLLEVSPALKDRP